MAKTIRFGDLVRGCGRPEPVTLWVDPKKDPAFSKALRENRVITVYTHPAGHRKDYGEIGFHEERGATYLVFPRALPKQSESRIVGINYQLAEDAPAKGPLAQTQPPKKTKDFGRRKGKHKVRELLQKVPAKPPKPEPKTYDVVVRRTAVLEEMERVKAFSEEQARERAVRSIKHKRFVLSRAVHRDEVISSAEAR